MTGFGPLLRLMRNGTIPEEEAAEIMYYLQLRASGNTFSAAKAQHQLDPPPTPSDD